MFCRKQPSPVVVTKLSAWLACMALLTGPLLMAAGPVPGFNTATPYLIYYGNWNATQVDFARNNYRMVMLHPQSNISASQIATIRRGPDNLAGTSDDVLVLAYISIGEDDRPGAPVVGDGLGPRVDPRSSDSEPLSSITNVIGAPSPGGTGYASYYLETASSADGVPDQNPVFGGCYVNAGAPAWWDTIKNMTKSSSGRAGLDEILTSATGNGFNCDGLFLDTIDTAAPNSFGGTQFEWTAPGMQSLVARISTNYPGKVLLANRGVFFYHPNFRTFAYNLRPYVHMVMFESYYTDSSNSGTNNAYFDDNKNNFAPKLNAEAGRPDGFTMVALGYTSTPPQSPAIVAQDFEECMRIQGWPLYRTDPSLTSGFNTAASQWASTNADTQPPVWDSTAAQPPAVPPPRVGIQQAVPGDHSVTVRWDVARDQTVPVRYNVYYTDQPTLNFGTAIKLSHVAPEMPANYALGTGAGSYPYEYTVTGLSNGVTYLFAVRAEDGAVPAHEDTNTVTLPAVPGTNAPTGSYRKITIDGDFSDWAGIPWLYHGSATGNPINFADVQFANDANYLYCHFTLHTAGSPFSDFNTHLFVDADNEVLTGFHPTGVSIGSEMMIEGATGYDQRNGGWNEGAVSGTSWLLAPSGSATEFEFRLSLASTYAGAVPVFAGNLLRLLLHDNRGSEVSGSAGIEYGLASPPPPTYAHITVDGNTSEWAGIPVLATAPPTNTPLSFASLNLANDNNYLYLRFQLHGSGLPFSDFNTHIFLDTDNNSGTGYPPTGISIGSELLIESGTGYDERNGSYNAGTVGGLDWLLSPAGAGTNFEARISRNAEYTGGAPVFPNSTVRIALQDNRGSVLIPEGVVYTFADGGPYEDWRAFYFTPAELENPAISGNGADASGDGIPNLVKYAFDLNPRGQNTPELPAGSIVNSSGTNFFSIQFVRRNPPADVQYIPQISNDLVAWDSSPANFVQVGSAPSTNDTSIVTLRLQTPIEATPVQFVRVAIE